MDSDLSYSVGDNIKRLCGLHDISQGFLAEFVGMSKQGLNNIVVGRSQPSVATAQKIAAAFAISLDELFADTSTAVRAGAIAILEAPILIELERLNRETRPGNLKARSE